MVLLVCTGNWDNSTLAKYDRLADELEIRYAVQYWPVYLATVFLTVSRSYYFRSRTKRSGIRQSVVPTRDQLNRRKIVSMLFALGTR
jgi:hypothetical protein